MHWSHLASDFIYENTCFEPYQAISFIVVCCMQQEASEKCCTIGSTVTSIQPGCRTPISSSTAGVSSSCPIRGIRKETFQVQANLQTRPLRALSSKKTLCKGVWPPCHHSVEVNLSHHKQQQFVFHYQIKSQAAKEHSTGALYLSRLYGKGYF